MNNIQVFTHPDLGQIRTIQRNGEIWFVGKDIAERLGYSNTTKAIRDHVDDEDKLTERIVLLDRKLTSQIGTSGQNRKMIIINESGMYSLVLSSKLPTAKSFKRWVTSEVLPSIRRTGTYTQAIVPKPNYDTVGLIDLPPQIYDKIDTVITADNDASRCLVAILNLLPPHLRTPIRVLVEEYGSRFHLAVSTREEVIEECGEKNFLRYARVTKHCKDISEV